MNDVLWSSGKDGMAALFEVVQRDGDSASPEGLRVGAESVWVD